MRRSLVVLTALTLAAAACAGDDDDESRKADEFPRGGALRLSMGPQALSAPGSLDPQRSYSGQAFELFRCCLLRTLLSYSGRPTEEGGAVLRPDLATSQPQISGDGLTWTFRLKQGLRYGPPYEAKEIVAPDVIRALERELAPGSKAAYGFYYDIIEGAADYSAGRAESISGLEARDRLTLVVHLTKPTGELGARLALPAAAPIPAGAAEGHADDYERFVVASGPYMIAGSERRHAKRPASGYRPGRSLTLVRNPSWTRSSDALRGAYVDRIEIGLKGADSDVRKVEAGDLDLVFDLSPPPTYWREQERRRVFHSSEDATWGVWMKVAVPPFDDLHVRKAVNLVLDKRRLREEFTSRPGFRGWRNARVMGHIVPDSLANNLLLDYDPYHTAADRGDPKRARVEMARSRYDRDDDGRCDASVCRNVLGYAFSAGQFPRMARTIVDNLGEIGIRVNVRAREPQALFVEALDPRNKAPIILTVSWLKDFAGSSTFFVPTFYGPGIGSAQMNTNFSLVGARPSQLRRWAYPVRSVPNIDPKIEECLALYGNAASQCWAETDQLLMETVVPWAPFLTPTTVRTVSERVVRFSFAQATALPALDQIALNPDAG